jgi:hypothetical protein
MLREYSTKLLVEKLKEREGIETIIVSPSQNVEICVYDKDTCEFIYDKMEDGPFVILKICD